MVVADSPDFVTLFLAAMRIGAIPVPVSTMLPGPDIAELLRDSRARCWPSPRSTPQLADGGRRAGARTARPDLDRRPAGDRGNPPAAPVGRPGSDGGADRLGVLDHRGLARILAVHIRHHRIAEGGDAPARVRARRLRELRQPGARDPARRSGLVGGQRLLRVRPGQLGAVPALGRGRVHIGTRALPAGQHRRRAPASTARRSSSAVRRSSPTCCGRTCPPMSSPGSGSPSRPARRCRPGCTSGGPSQFGVDIIDGIGMTETLHIFLSNRPGEVRAGTTGVAVPGYEVRVVDEGGPRSCGRRRPGRSVVRGALGGDRLLVPLCRLPAGLRRRVGAHRRHLRQRRGRLPHLPRPHRRHAQGRRHLGVPGGGGGPAARARRRSAQAVVVAGIDAGRIWRSRSPSWSAGAGGTTTEDELDRVLPRGPAVVQAAPQGDLRRRLSDHGDRQDPAGRAAR